MDYELRIIADCPNSAAALDLFVQVLAAEGVEGDVVVVELGSEEQAQTLGFHCLGDGSVPIFGSTSPDLQALSACRRFGWPAVTGGSQGGRSASIGPAMTVASITPSNNCWSSGMHVLRAHVSTPPNESNGPFSAERAHRLLYRPMH